MAQVEADVGTQQMADTPEPLFGTIDYIILVALLGFATWWLLKRKNRQEETSSIKSYSIQYVFNLATRVVSLIIFL